MHLEVTRRSHVTFTISDTDDAGQSGVVSAEDDISRIGS
jgi:hypothetical protein